MQRRELESMLSLATQRQHKYELDCLLAVKPFPALKTRCWRNEPARIDITYYTIQPSPSQVFSAS